MWERWIETGTIPAPALTIVGLELTTSCIISDTVLCNNRIYYFPLTILPGNKFLKQQDRKVKITPGPKGCRMDVMFAGRKTTLITLYITVSTPKQPGILSLNGNSFKEFFFFLVSLKSISQQRAYHIW